MRKNRKKHRKSIHLDDKKNNIARDILLNYLKVVDKSLAI